MTTTKRTHRLLLAAGWLALILVSGAAFLLVAQAGAYAAMP